MEEFVKGDRVRIIAQFHPKEGKEGTVLSRGQVLPGMDSVRVKLDEGRNSTHDFPPHKVEKI